MELCFEGLDYYMTDLSIESLMSIQVIFDCLPSIFTNQFRKSLMIRLLVTHSTLIYPILDGQKTRERTFSTTVSDIHAVEADGERLNGLIKKAYKRIEIENADSYEMKSKIQEMYKIGNLKNGKPWKYKPEHLASFIEHVLGEKTNINCR